MNPQQLQQQAQQAASEGQAQYQNDINQANQSSGQSQQFQQQASQANQNLSNYTDYLKGAGSGANTYNTQLGQQEQNVGLDPKVLATATQNLTQGQNALYGLNQASQASTGGYGLSGAQLGNYYASQSQPLANQIQTQGQAVGNLTGLLTAAQTGANQATGANVQTEQITSQNLASVFTNAQAQQTQAQQSMQFYSQLASTQGGLNASEQQAYDAALQSYQQAQADIAQAAMYGAQAGLFGAQTTGQNISNQAAQNQLNATLASQAKAASGNPSSGSGSQPYNPSQGVYSTDYYQPPAQKQGLSVSWL